MLLPLDLRDWVPDNHLVHFIVEVASYCDDDKAQFNFTDPDSRVMKAGSGAHFEQACNAQAAVDTEGSMLIVGQRVTNHANDKEELVPAVAAVDPAIRQLDNVLADSGFYSESSRRPWVSAAFCCGESGTSHWNGHWSLWRTT